jgi:hypothetical protein
MRLLGLLTLASLGLQAQEVIQEGSDWVRRISGGQAIPAQVTRIEVHAQGGIALRGSLEDRLSYSYTLTQRIPVASRTTVAQARQALNGGRVWGGTANATILVDSDGASPNVTTLLELKVPQRLLQASLDVKFGGDVSVYDFNGNVFARTGSGAIRGGRIHGSMNAWTGSGEIRFDGAVDGSVDCFTGAGSITIESAGGHVNCQTGGGQTIVKQAVGPVQLTAEGGDISVEHARSSVEARSASGLIDVGQAGGLVTAITQGGSIQVGPARGVHAESGRGTIRLLRGVSGPLSLSAAMGNIVAELMTGVPIQDSTFVTRAGDIRVFLPSNLAVSVMATEDSGGNPRIQSDFAEFRAGAFGWTRTPVVIQGAINGGGPVLHLSAPAIYILKTK